MADSAAERRSSRGVSTSARYEVHLRDYLSIVYKRLSIIIVVASLVFVLVTVPEAKKPKLYRTSATLMVRPPSPSFLNASGVSYYLMSKQEFDTQLYLMRSKGRAQTFIRKLVAEGGNRDLLHELGFTKDAMPTERELEGLADSFRARLTVSALPETNVVTLSLSGREPSHIQRLLDLYCLTCVEENGKRASKHLEDSSAQLAKLIPELRDNIDQKISEKKDLIRNTPFSQHALLVEKEQLERLGTDYVQERTEARQLAAGLRTTLDVLLTIPEVANHERVEQAREERRAIRDQFRESVQLQRLADEFGDSLLELLDAIPDGLADRGYQDYVDARSGLIDGLSGDSVRAARTRERFEEVRTGAEDVLLASDFLAESFLAVVLQHPQVDEAEGGERLREIYTRYATVRGELASSSQLQASEVEELRSREVTAREELQLAIAGVLESLVRERRRLSAASVPKGLEDGGEARSRSPFELQTVEWQMEIAVYDAVEDALLKWVDEVETTTELAPILSLMDLHQDLELSELHDDLRRAELEVQRARGEAEREDYKPGDRRYRELVDPARARADESRRQIVRHAARTLSTRALQLTSARSSLNEVKESLSAQIDLVGQIELTQSDFERAEFNIRTAQELLKSAVNEQQRVEFDAKLRENNVSIAEHPRVPPAGAFLEPDIDRAIFMGVVFGLLAGFGLAFVLEYLDDTIKSPSDIDRYVGAPILGAIPTMSTKAADRKDLISFYEPKASVSEAFRSVRTALMFTMDDEERNTFVVTSVGPREGKTTVSVNLAITLAQSGSRTLLVDCDLRRPRVHKAFGLEENLGLTNVLVGGAAVEDYARDTDVPNLQLLTSGPIPPNPSELVGSKKMRDFFAELATKYDKVIYDTPPLAAVTDGVILGGMVNGLILVISSQKTTKKLAQRAVEQLDNVGVPIFGVVLNNVKASHGYYYYSSYYRYYGEDTSKASS